MKIELKFTNPKEGLPESTGYVLAFVTSEFNKKVTSEEVYYDDSNGVFSTIDSDNDGYSYVFKTGEVLFWAKMPSYGELIKNKD